MIHKISEVLHELGLVVTEYHASIKLHATQKTSIFRHGSHHHSPTPVDGVRYGRASCLIAT